MVFLYPCAGVKPQSLATVRLVHMVLLSHSADVDPLLRTFPSNYNNSAYAVGDSYTVDR
jgi:hypothetical protein